LYLSPLARRGYAADFQPDGLLAKYRPELLSLSTTNGEHSQGDGHKMALAIGASAVDLEKVQVHPTGLVDPADVDAKVKVRFLLRVRLYSRHFVSRHRSDLSIPTPFQCSLTGSPIAVPRR
jgi:hypothetical protein